MVRLLQDPTQADRLAERGAAFAAEYYRRNVQALADVVNGAGAW
jgi:hypothetical protein